MSKIKIVIDSTSCIDLMPDKFDAEVLRLFIIFDGKQYIDGETITPEEFYKMIENNPHALPSTSQPTIGGTLEQFERLAKEGYDEIICLTISKGLSGTYATTVSAKEMVEADIKITIIDSRTLAIPLFQLGKIAFEMVESGKTTKEIVAYINRIKNDYKIYLAVGDLTLLKKNGRLSTASAFIGKILKVKPVLKVDDAGIIESVSKVRTMKKAVNNLVDTFLEISNGKASDITILNSNCLELAEQFKKLLVAKDQSLADIPIYALTPLIGAHLGAGTIGITFKVNE